MRLKQTNADLDGPATPGSRRIAVLAVPGVQLLDVCGPLDVFAEANRQAGRRIYELVVVSTVREPVSASGVRLVADRLIGEPLGAVHTLLAAGRPDAAETGASAAELAWLAKIAPTAQRYGSICTGAFALAEAGLLNGKRVATHWAAAARLAERFPEVMVEADAIHVRDGKVRTCAGVTAGLDLALALVEEDFGRQLAQTVAGQLVMFFKRPGGQLQFSRHGEMQLQGRAALQDLQRWVAARPGEDHCLARLAERAGMSARHLTRLFRQELGMTPGQWVEAARITAARTLLEAGRLAPKQAATACGFANADSFRRAFQRVLGVSPAQYRRMHGRAPA